MRDDRLDFGRCLAALFVVYVHFSIAFLPKYDQINRLDWFVADLVNTLGRVCVPLFIMMSGALVIGKPIDSWADYATKRSLATLKPYVFGSVVYFIWRTPEFSYPPNAFEYLKSFLSGGGFFHLYFLFVLLGLYLITPILQGIEKVSNSALLGTVIVLFALVTIDRHIGPAGLSMGYLTLGNCFSYLPYFLLGYLLYRRMDIARKYAVAGFVVTTAFSMVLVWHLTVHPIGKYDAPNFQQYTSFNVIIQSFFAFNIILNFKVTAGALRTIIRWFSEKSLGIYVLHFVVLVEFRNFANVHIFMPAGLQVFLYPAIIFMLTALLVAGLQKIPFLKGFI